MASGRFRSHCDTSVSFTDLPGSKGYGEPVPKRVDHEERRRQIADALLRTAAARGLHATGMREVAAEAGVSLRLVQYYFGTKEELLLSGMQHLAARFGEGAMTRIRRIKEAGREASPRDVIAAILAEALPADDERRTFAVLNAAYFALALTDPALAIAPLVKNTNAVIDVVAAQLRAAQAAGDTPAHLQPDAEALSLLAMSAGLGNSVLAGQSSLEQAQAVIDYHLDRLFPANGRPLGRLRVFRSYVSSPASRWHAVAVLERAAECRLRCVADVLRDERDWKRGVAEQVGGGVQAYVREIGGWRLPEASDEPRSERRPGKAARSGQLTDCPVVAGVSMDSAQGRTDLRVERTGQPVRFGVRASGPGAQNLDEEQIEDTGDHHRRSLRGRLHLEYEHPAGHFEPFERLAAGAAQDDHGREAREQVARLRIADREGSAEPARRLGRVVLGCAGAHGRVRVLACLADVVRVAAREQDDIPAAHALDVRVAVDPKHEFALFNDVQGAGIAEAD